MEDLSDLVWQSAGIKKPASNHAPIVSLAHMAAANSASTSSKLPNSAFATTPSKTHTTPTPITPQPARLNSVHTSPQQYSPVLAPLVSRSLSTTPAPPPLLSKKQAFPSALGFSNTPQHTRSFTSSPAPLDSGFKSPDPFSHLVSFRTTQPHIPISTSQPHSPVSKTHFAERFADVQPHSIKTPPKVSNDLASADLSFLESIASSSPAPSTLIDLTSSSTSSTNQTDDINLLDDFLGPQKPTQRVVPTAAILAATSSLASPIIPRTEVKANPSPNLVPTVKPKDDPFDKNLAMLVGRGFDPNVSAEALRAADGNVEMAVDLMMGEQSNAKPRQSSAFSKAGFLNKATSLINKSKEVALAKAAELKEHAATAMLAHAVQNGISAIGGAASDQRPSTFEDIEFPSSYSDKPPNRPTLQPQLVSSRSDMPVPNAGRIQPPVPTTSRPTAHAILTRTVPEKKSRPNVVTCSSIVWDQVQAHKVEGNDAYKRGQYHEAVASYGLAINLLPPKHVALIPLYNNRAASQLKTGEYKECIADTEHVISVLEHYHGLESTDDKITDVVSETTVTMADIIKAQTRQASAYEAIEKLQMAMDVFAKVLALDPGNKLAVEGIARCKRGLCPTPQATKAAMPIQSKPLDTMVDLFDPLKDVRGSTPMSTTQVSQSHAVKEMRLAAAKAEAEDDQAFALKDDVDAQILAWRKGKEQNLRALLSSLNLVLWPELALTPPALSELITPQQVKIKYMKVISKLHPDKLKSDAVHHKLIASAVFAALNEAWDGFRAQNNM